MKFKKVLMRKPITIARTPNILESNDYGIDDRSTINKSIITVPVLGNIDINYHRKKTIGYERSPSSYKTRKYNA